MSVNFAPATSGDWSGTTSFALSAGGTVAVWINPAQGSATDDTFIRAQWINGATTSRIYMNRSAGGTTLFANLDDPAGFKFLSGGVMPVNTWSHCATTFDGVTLRLYVNAVQVASTPATTTNGVATINSLRVGQPPTPECKATMQCAIFYNTALTAGQIATLMQTQTPPTATALVSWYPLMGSGTAAMVDASGNGRNLTAVGTPHDGATVAPANQAASSDLIRRYSRTAGRRGRL